MSTINKIPQVRPDENWENWDMEALINNLRQWLKRHKVDDAPGDSGGARPKREKHWYNKEKGDPVCIFRGGKHWGEKTRIQFFQEKKLFQLWPRKTLGKPCRGRGCFKCKSKHDTSLCDKDKNRPPGDNGTVLTSYSPSADEWSLPAIIPVKIKGETFWAYLDTGAGRNFITSEAVKRLNLKAERHEVREILTLNGSKRQSMPIFNLSTE